MEARALRLLNDALWERVNARQHTLDAVLGTEVSRLMESRQPDHLLTSPVHCYCCGSSNAAMGRDHLACSAARKLGTCSAKTGMLIRKSLLNFLRNQTL